MDSDNNSEDEECDITRDLCIRQFSFIDKLADNELSIHEYCKAFTIEKHPRDFDDICEVAVVVLKRIAGEQSEDFKLQMIQSISDVFELVEAGMAGPRDNAAGGQMTQAVDEGDRHITFE